MKKSGMIDVSNQKQEQRVTCSVSGRLRYADLATQICIDLAGTPTPAV